MSRLARTLLFVLVALWLPVTLHCRLEAAGVLDQHDACCASEPTAVPLSGCQDACPTVEEALFKESAQDLKVDAPALNHCFACFSALALERDLRAEPTLSPVRHAPPLELRVAWQFITRAAPPARAPSLNS
jgi:hypothetical protein